MSIGKKNNPEPLYMNILGKTYRKSVGDFFQNIFRNLSGFEFIVAMTLGLWFWLVLSQVCPESL